jgi:hypothetical protein
MRMCAHLAHNTRQPLAAILDSDGAERHFCAACSAQRVAAMLLTTPPKDVASALLFDRCDHHKTPICHPCYLGVTGYLSLVWSMLTFEDKPLAHRLSKTLRKLGSLYGDRPFKANPAPKLENN